MEFVISKMHKQSESLSFAEYLTSVKIVKVRKIAMQDIKGLTATSDVFIISGSADQFLLGKV